MTKFKPGDKMLIEAEFVEIDEDGDIKALYLQDEHELEDWFAYPRPDVVHRAPPLTTEVLEALERRAGDVQVWDAMGGRWIISELDLDEWESSFNSSGNQPQPGYRIVAASPEEDSDGGLRRTWTDAPQLTSDIIEHLENGGAVEQWDPFTQSWHDPFPNLGVWQRILSMYGDQIQPGFRFSIADAVVCFDEEPDDGMRIQVRPDPPGHMWAWRIVGADGLVLVCGGILEGSRMTAVMAGTDRLNEIRDVSSEWEDA